LALLFLAPSLFASNMLIARATADLVPPVALAFWRWAVTLAIVLPMTAVPLWRSRRALAREWLQFLVLGALGMGVCGAFVYIGADTASATNIGLIYASSPIMIIVLASLFGHERLNARQGLGILFSLIGVLTVISRGDLDALLALRFTEGDLWIITSAFAWAVYSLLLRYWRSSLPPMARFAATVACGVFVLAPAALWEGLNVGWPVLNKETVGAVLFLAVFASFAAYQVYAMIQRSLGAGLASLMLYLSPIYLAILAFLLLGETLKPYHYVGAALVLPGIYLATRRPKPQTTRDL
jgi:drug/metabolite transporter (DMT)-like permease